MILTKRVKSVESLLMADAIANSSIRYDQAGNPALERHALSAFVIAAGLAEIEAAKPKRRLRWA